MAEESVKVSEKVSVGDENLVQVQKLMQRQE